MYEKMLEVKVEDGEERTKKEAKVREEENICVVILI